jgi:hypothetical protein
MSIDTRAYNDELMDLVWDQMQDDLHNQDFTAIEELLKRIEPQYLVAYLSEDRQLELNSRFEL